MISIATICRVNRSIKILSSFFRLQSTVTNSKTLEYAHEVKRPTESPPYRLRLSLETRAHIASLLERRPVTNQKNLLTAKVSKDDGATEIPNDKRPKKGIFLTPDVNLNDSPFKAVRKKLPIFSYREEILKLINENQVIVLSGATGSGKTTQVPQYIMEDCAEKKIPCRIICTQTRRLAATSIAQRVASERNDVLGQSVGYQIRLDSCVSPNSNLIFTTSGFLLRRIIGEKSSELFFSGLTHLIFDEVHEREDITDFLLIAIKDALKLHPHLKVVVMSATLDADIFCDYFSNCPRIDIPGRMYPVAELFLNEILELTSYKTLYMEQSMQSYQDHQDNNDLLCQAYQWDRNGNPDQIDHNLLLCLIKHIHTTEPVDGSILVFLPGLQDITEQQNFIIESMPSEEYRLYLLHSSLNGTERCDRDQVFEKLPEGKRKIILSTNIAQTSLTIDDVAYVIDTGKSKQNKFNYHSQTSLLRSQWISKACAKQRSGRAGRTKSGTCYRLYSIEDYEAMDEYVQPEILRVPLTDICLNSKILFKNGSIKEFLLKAIQPPSVNSICKSVDILKRIDALDSDECITALGLHLAKLPVDAQVGKCIFYAILLNCLDPILTIVSMLSTNNTPFDLSLDNMNKKASKVIKRMLANGTMSDHIAKLNAFNGWLEAKSQGLEVEFAFDNYLINDDMMVVNGIRSLITDHLKSSGLLHDKRDLNQNSAKISVIKACLSAGLYPNICRIDKYAEKFSSKSDDMLALKSSVVGKSRNKLSPKLLQSGYDWVLYGSRKSFDYTKRFDFVGDVTPLTDAHIALFCGPINLAPPFPISFENEDSQRLYAIDDLCQFACTENDANLLFNLRYKFNEIFVRMLKSSHGFTKSNDDDDVIATVVNVLESEEKLMDDVDVT